MTTTVLGLDALLARFAKGVALAELAETVVVDKLADDVAETARQIVPVDTGTLQESITSEGGRVSTDVPYAAFVEYGTSYTPPQPYMRPAADTTDDAGAIHAGEAVLRGL